MKAAAESLEIPALHLNEAREAEFCAAASHARHNEIWWYFNGLAPYQGFSRPFADEQGRWWYCVKPGFAWPVNFFRPIYGRTPHTGLRTMLGRQYPVETHSQNSQVWMNVIHNLAGYDLGRVDPDKRRAIRKGLKNLDIAVGNPADPQIAKEACDVWNSHVERTGWNTPMNGARFAETWRELHDWVGTTVLLARDRATGVLCAWLIARVIDDCVYVDTIASHTDRLANRPNDTIIFACLASAAAQGVRSAHYSLKSKLEKLETFKQSLGFVAHGFSAKLDLRWGVAPLLRSLAPNAYRRLLGDADWYKNTPAVSAPAVAAV